jgi:hypothetical protein
MKIYTTNWYTNFIHEQKRFVKGEDGNIFGLFISSGNKCDEFVRASLSCVLSLIVEYPAQNSDNQAEPAFLFVMDPHNSHADS